MEFDIKLFNSLINEAENFPEVPLRRGRLKAALDRDGIYREDDLVFTKEDEKLAIYYAGFAILCKDINEYLSELPGDESTALFNEVFNSVIYDEKRRYKAEAYPYSDPGFPDRDWRSNLPKGYAASAAQGSPTIENLDQSDLVHEKAVKPGKRLFDKFARKFKETICGKGGPYEKFCNGLIGQADLPTAIVGAIIATGFSIATIWIPFLMYIVLLIIKAGLKTYCED